MRTRNRPFMQVHAALPALAAAALFGASTPLAKLLVGDVSPNLLAGLLYLGCGAGLGLLLLWRIVRAPACRSELRIARRELPWLLGAVVAGGVVAPPLLMAGLATTPGTTASLLLNVEGAFTALIAWLVFKENADRYVVLGFAAILLGGVLLSWAPGPAASAAPGAVLIVAACLAWAVDNNLTRKVSNNDAMLLACIKGLIAGTCNTAVAWFFGAPLPTLPAASASLVVGFAGYGLSLTLFVVALRRLGTARTGAYFSVAPLFGVVLSLLLWPEMPSLLFWAAALLMAAGVWLHVRETHEHAHTHEALDHAHRHRHDAHHLHTHDFDWDGHEPHAHRHVHEALTHKHPHYPDIHHRHQHGGAAS